jgi:hypothetical protein
VAEKRRTSLARKFAKAAAGVVIGVTLLYGGWFGALYAGRGDKLTKNESKLLTSIFGDEINTSKIRKHFREESSVAHILPSKIGMVPPPFSHIDFYGEKHWSKDYAKDSANFGLFTHEATHCWQGQTMTFPLHDIGKYEYTLTKTSRFNDFGTEQQADIIENYSKAWLFGPSTNHTAQDTLLFNVVEKRCPTAHKTRLAVERKGVPVWKL